MWRVLRVLLGIIMPSIIGSYLIVIGVLSLSLIDGKPLRIEDIKVVLMGPIFLAYFVGFLVIIPSILYSIMMESLVNPAIKNNTLCLLIGSLYGGLTALICLQIFNKPFEANSVLSFFCVIGLLTGLLVTALLRYLYNKDPATQSD